MSLHEECGVVGIFHHESAATHAYFALHALQHRGQEGAGIAASDGEKLYCYKGQGLVADVFQDGKLRSEALPRRITDRLSTRMFCGRSWRNRAVSFSAAVIVRSYCI